MPSSFKTTNLELNYWINTDKPVRTDFNRDNAIIDNALGGHINNTMLHLTQSDLGRLRDTYSIKVLQGTDEPARELTLTFEPSAVIYYAIGKPPAVYTEGTNRVYFAAVAKESGGSGGITLSGSRVIIKQNTTDSVVYDLNSSDCQYVLLAVR